jgi:hypothetical protein
MTGNLAISYDIESYHNINIYNYYKLKMPEDSLTHGFNVSIYIESTILVVFLVHVEVRDPTLHYFVCCMSLHCRQPRRYESLTI